MAGAFLLVTALCGCTTHRALQKHTIAANLTVADIYHQQVLNNIARFEVNPAAMPAFSVVTSGTVNITDEASGGANPTYSPTLTAAQQGGGALPILSILFNSSTSRSVTENWSTTPVIDSDNLRRMRCAFQVIVGQETSECDQCQDRLKGFFFGGTESYDCMLPTNWYYVGQECEVPKNACYVANYCDLYVWVMPSGLDGLSRFTITILDIATGEIRAEQRQVVKHYKGDEADHNLESTEITVTETDVEAMKKTDRFRADRQRTSSGAENRGLFFVPK
jgi:hypothetical protein